MNGIRFEWGSAKAATNKVKHGVTFDEAKSVFYDPRALAINDPDHSLDGQRFIILGLSRVMRVLTAHRLREAGDVIRIISARKATANETETYIRRVR